MFMTNLVRGPERVVTPRAPGKREGLWASVWSAVQSVSMPTLRVVAERAFSGRALLDAVSLSEAFAAQGVQVDESLSALLVVADGVEQGGQYVLSLPQLRRAILAHGAVLHGPVGARQLVFNRNSRLLIALAHLAGDQPMGLSKLRQSFERLCLRPPQALLDLLMNVLGTQSTISVREIEQAVADGLIDLHDDMALEGIVVGRVITRWLAKMGGGSLVANQLVDRLRQANVFLSAHHAGLLQAAFGSRYMFGFALLSAGDLQRALDQGVVAASVGGGRIDLSLVEPTHALQLALDNSPYFKEAVSDATRFARGLGWLMTWSETSLIDRVQANAIVAAYGVNGVIRVSQIKDLLREGVLQVSNSCDGWSLVVNVHSEGALFRKLSEQLGGEGFYSVTMLVDVLPKGDAFILPAEADLLVRAYGVPDERGHYSISLAQVRQALVEGFLVSSAVNGRIQLNLSAMAQG